MPHPRVRHEHDAEAGLADAQAPLGVLGVGEERLVEEPRALDRSTRDGHRRARRAIDVTQRVEPAVVTLPEAVLPAPVPEPQVHAPAGVHQDVGRIGEEHLAGEHARVRTGSSRSLEGSRQAGFRDRIVVQEQHPVGSASQGTPDPDVVAPGEAEVDTGADQLDAREPCCDRIGRTVVRAVVDTDRLDPFERLECRERVVAAVPVEDDRDELHEARVKCAIDPAPGRRLQVRPRSISPTSRATPGYDVPVAARVDRVVEEHMAARPDERAASARSPLARPRSGGRRR